MDSKKEWRIGEDNPNWWLFTLVEPNLLFPSRIAPRNIGTEHLVRLDDDDGPVAFAYGDDHAKRIIACVNGCAGIKNPEAIAGVVAVLAGAQAQLAEDLVRATAQNSNQQWIDNIDATLVWVRAALAKLGEA